MIAEARAERELPIGERNRAPERDAGAGEVLLGDVETAERRERTSAPVRLGIGGEAEPEVVDDDRVALDDVDDEDDVASLRTAPERELHVAEEAGAEQTEARELQLPVVDIEDGAALERDESKDDAGERRRVSPDLDAFEDVAEAALPDRRPRGARLGRRGRLADRGSDRRRRRRRRLRLRPRRTLGLGGLLGRLRPPRLQRPGVGIPARPDGGEAESERGEPTHGCEHTSGFVLRSGGLRTSGSWLADVRAIPQGLASGCASG